MNVLQAIVEAKRRRLEQDVPGGPALAPMHAPDRLLAAFREEGAAEAPFRVIAEMKKASPSGGLIRSSYDPVSIARQYRDAGAFALSVLTEEDFFQGSLEDLRAVRRAVSLPILRKDFIVAPRQVLESRDAGADLVLLIVACLSDADLRTLISEAERWRLLPLVEVHDEAEAERALRAGARLVGINNRNLKTLQISLETGARVARFIRAQEGSRVVLVGESGIRSRHDMQQLADEGCQAFLIGESLLRSESPGEALRNLLGGEARRNADSPGIPVPIREVPS